MMNSFTQHNNRKVEKMWGKMRFYNICRTEHRPVITRQQTWNEFAQTQWLYLHVQDWKTASTSSEIPKEKKKEKK